MGAHLLPNPIPSIRPLICLSSVPLLLRHLLQRSRGSTREHSFIRITLSNANLRSMKTRRRYIYIYFLHQVEIDGYFKTKFSNDAFQYHGFVYIYMCINIHILVSLIKVWNNFVSPDYAQNATSCVQRNRFSSFQLSNRRDRINTDPKSSSPPLFALSSRMFRMEPSDEMEPKSTDIPPLRWQVKIGFGTKPIQFRRTISTMVAPQGEGRGTRGRGDFTLE